MEQDSEIVLIGTGLAPLIAANRLVTQGKTVSVLNPDPDFFLEDSELPLDPFLPANEDTMVMSRLKRSLLDSALEILRPEFPGAIESWSPKKAGGIFLGRKDQEQLGFHDSEAPHVRGRARLWIQSPRSRIEPRLKQAWDNVEEMFIHSLDSGYHPVHLDGISAVARFPGYSGHPTELEKGILFPQVCDVDVDRVRQGVLEFVRERLEERIYTSVNSIEVREKTLKFRDIHESQSFNVKQKILVFWTPRMSTWISRQKGFESLLLNKDALPTAIRLWESWELVSREVLDPSVVGVFEDNLIWAHIEGSPDFEEDPLYRLSVLRSGEKLSWKQMMDPQFLKQTAQSWISKQSFESISSLCHDFLNWEYFSVHSVKARATFEWGGQKSRVDQHMKWPAISPLKDSIISIVSGCDGPLLEVVRNASRVAQRCG